MTGVVFLYFCFAFLSVDNDKSSAQRKYEQERFRVQPGRIEDYSLGRGSIASQEVKKVKCHLY